MVEVLELFTELRPRLLRLGLLFTVPETDALAGLTPVLIVAEEVAVTPVLMPELPGRDVPDVPELPGRETAALAEGV